MIKRLTHNQKGMTLLEMVTVTALVGLLTVVFGSISYSIIYHTQDNRAHISAASGMENAIIWITRDGLRANNTDLIPGSGAVNSLTISWTDPIAGDFYEIFYFVTSSNLRRRESINSIVQMERTVETNVTGIGFSQPLNETWMFKVSLTLSGGSNRVNEMREYHVLLRNMG
jgi:prepilin-type N-terminal cleavage/methylation domain-containing protein